MCGASCLFTASEMDVRCYGASCENCLTNALKKSRCSVPSMFFSSARISISNIDSTGINASVFVFTCNGESLGESVSSSGAVVYSGIYSERISSSLSTLIGLAMKSSMPSSSDFSRSPFIVFAVMAIKGIWRLIGGTLPNISRSLLRGSRRKISFVALKSFISDIWQSIRMKLFGRRTIALITSCPYAPTSK